MGKDVLVEKMGTSRDLQMEYGWLSRDQEGASVPRGQDEKDRWHTRSLRASGGWVLLGLAGLGEPLEQVEGRGGCGHGE